MINPLLAILVLIIIVIATKKFTQPKTTTIIMTINGLVQRKGVLMNLSVDLPVKLALAELDQFGNAEQVVADAPPVWAMADATQGALVVAADGMSAVVTPSGKLGDMTITASGSFDGKAFNASGTGTLVAGAVASVSMSLSQ